MPFEEPGTLGSIKVKIELAAMLTIFGLFLCVLFWNFPQIREPLTYSMAVVAALAVVFSGYYVAASLAVTVQRDKVHRSFEFTKQLNEVNFARMRTFLDKELDHHKMAPEEFYKKVVENDDIYSSLKSVLGTFEDASIAVQFDYVDEAALYASLSYLVPWCARSFQPYISEQRRIAGCGTLYAELDKLANAWNSQKSLKTGKSL